MKVKRNNPDYQHGPVREFTADEIAAYEASEHGRAMAERAAQASAEYTTEHVYVCEYWDADNDEMLCTIVTAHSAAQARTIARARISDPDMLREVYPHATG